MKTTTTNTDNTTGIRRCYVCDLRREFAGNRYITFWRPNNANYAYPLEWSGKYSLDELKPGYHEVKEGRSVVRFAVPCEAADSLAVMSKTGQIDGGPTLVVENTEVNRRKLRAKRLPLSQPLPQPLTEGRRR